MRNLIAVLVTALPLLCHAHHLNSVNRVLGRRHNWEHHVMVNHMVTHFHIH